MRYIKGNYFIVPNRDTLDLLDSSSQNIFIWICAYANEEGRCFPSLTTIAKKSKLSLATVKRRIPQLEKQGFIEKISGNSKKSNEYQILLGGRLTESLGRVSVSLGVGSHRASNNNKLIINRNKGINRKPIKEKKPIKVNLKPTKTNGALINEIMDHFKVVNPMWENLFKRNVERLALDRMVVKYGEEKITKVIDSLADSNGAEFAPVITSPTILERKFGLLVAYWRREKTKEIRQGSGEKELIGME